MINFLILIKIFHSYCWQLTQVAKNITLVAICIGQGHKFINWNVLDLVVMLLELPKQELRL